jgi:hypothetical protein
MDEWESLGQMLDRIRADGLSRVTHATDRARMANELAQLMRDFERSAGERDGAAAFAQLVQHLAPDAAQWAAQEYARTSFERNRALLHRATEIWAACWNSAKGRGASKTRDAWQDLTVALMAKAIMIEDPTPGRAAAIRGAMARGNVATPRALNGEASYLKRIARIMQSPGIDRAWAKLMDK